MTLGQRRVLVIFPGALGDLLCFAPALKAIALRHCEAGVELMARQELACFAGGRLGTAGAHSIDRAEVASLFAAEQSPAAAARSFFAQFQRIYSFFNRDDGYFRRMLCQAAPQALVTFHRFCRSAPGHIASAYLAEIGAQAQQPAIALNLMPEDLALAERALSGAARAGRFVAIFPGSGSRTKNWPIEKFVALADLSRARLAPVFVLGPAETDLEAFLRMRGQTLLKDIPLGTVAAIARMAAAFAGVDSGVSHLAAAAGCPGVVLFGPTDPEQWRPLGCVKILARKPIGAIEPDEVLSALMEISHGRIKCERDASGAP